MSRTNKILVTVVAAALAVAGFYFLALAPKREQLVKLDKDIAAKQAELAQARLNLATYEEARAGYKTNYAKLVRLGKAAPADDDVHSLLVQLESTADRSGVGFEKIELGTASVAAPTAGQPESQPAAGELASAPGSVPVAGGVLSAMPFSFSFSGSFFDLSAFFTRLEHFVTVNNERIDATGRLLRLETLKIAPSTAGFPNMEAQIGAATYIVPPVEGVEGAPAPGSPPAQGTTQASPSSTTASTGAAQ
jgi:Tfp pilus assembly protein PilO